VFGVDLFGAGRWIVLAVVRGPNDKQGLACELNSGA